MDLTTWPTQKQNPPSACGSRGFSRGVPRTLVSVSPAAYVTLSTGRKKKKVKNHAADELIKVWLAQVSHKVTGARDGRLFTGTADPKRFTRTRGSVEKLNERMLLPGECAMKFGSTAGQQAISWGSDLCGWPFIFLVTCRINSRVLLFECPVTWNDVEGFNSTCVCLFKSQLQVFPDQLLSYMMIQAN